MTAPRLALGDRPLSDPPIHLQNALASGYRIEGNLGQGGMATVYLAHGLKHDRKIAIKVLRPELRKTSTLHLAPHHHPTGR